MAVVAYPERYERDGVVVQIDPDRGHGLLVALETSPADETTPAEDVHLRGTPPGFSLAGDPGKDLDVYRKSPLNVRVHGQGIEAEYTSIRSLFSKERHGGIHRLVFRDLPFPLLNTKYPINNVNNPSRSSRIAFYDCLFQGAPKTYSAVRWYGAALEMVRCTVLDTVEWGAYWLLGRGPVLRGVRNGRSRIKDCRFVNCGRGGIQVAERNMESDGNLQTNRKPESLEVLEVDGFTAVNCGRDGASAISITGHPGRVWIHGPIDVGSQYKTSFLRLNFDAKQCEQEPIPAQGWAWARAIGPGKIGPDLRAHNEVVLDLREATIVLPVADRDVMLIDSVRQLTIASGFDTSIRAPRPLLSIEEHGNGEVMCPPGFENAGHAVARRDVADLKMLGHYNGWVRTGGWQENVRFLRGMHPFQPDEYYSQRAVT